MLEWRIYYGDRTTYSSEDGSPFDAPPDNVQAIVFVDPTVGRGIVAKRSIYYWVPEEGQWSGLMDQLGYGLFDYLRQPGARKVIFGRTISNAAYDAVIRQAVTDPDFPVKSANLPGEEFER